MPPTWSAWWRTMRLAIADPPYPPFVGSGGRKRRASRWYGDAPAAADIHASAAEWDAPERHRQLLLDPCHDPRRARQVAVGRDAIRSRGDSEAVIGREQVKPNAQPGSHRLRSMWEAVIVYPPVGRRSNRGGIGAVSDVLVYSAPRGFIGAKPSRWVEWVCEALSYDQAVDTLDDLFPAQGRIV